MKNDSIIKVAIPGRFQQCFDYSRSPEFNSYPIGARVEVPFGRRSVIGVIVGHADESEWDLSKLKAIRTVIDLEALLPADIMELCQWASGYYHYPLGEVIFAALPKNLRDGKPAERKQERYWRLTETGLQQKVEALGAARRQRELLELLLAHPHGLRGSEIKDREITQQTLSALHHKKWIMNFWEEKSAAPLAAAETPWPLNPEQTEALDAITEKFGQFQAILLEGITGSGKTEVYLQAIQQCLDQQKSALILIPEIGLTPQTFERFQKRFPIPIALLHSGLNDGQRLEAWLQAQTGQAKLLIGTRSAIFTPIPNLGLIIVDEEHDPSFKQQEGFRYSARDLAVQRARRQNCPIVLGSATPSLNSLLNANRERYQRVILSQRAGVANPPAFQLIDLRQHKLTQGLTQPLLAAMEQQLLRGHQVLLFINRRGYAPVLLCQQCGWIGRCTQCDANLTVHRSPAHLLCHHCGFTQAIPQHCQSCRHPNLIPLGVATERLEQTLQKHFPNFEVLRIDRDSTRRKGSLENILEKIQSGGAQIIIGTQMLAKGHHFPRLTMVGILDADSGFLSSDFSAAERLGQLLIQVAGRAGRAQHQGQVLIQTYHPNHPLLLALIQQGYAQFAELLLTERAQARLPPYYFFALFRAESPKESDTLSCLESIKNFGGTLSSNSIRLLGPIPAPMGKKANHYRAQLLCQTDHRGTLQEWLKAMVAGLPALNLPAKVKWSLDVDPIDLY